MTNWKALNLLKIDDRKKQNTLNVYICEFNREIKLPETLTSIHAGLVSQI